MRDWVCGVRAAGSALIRGRKSGCELDGVLMTVARLIRAEVARVELAVLGVDAWTGAGAFVHEETHDRRVRGADAARQLHGIPLAVAPLFRELVLIERRQRRTVLLDAALNPLGEDLGGICDVSHDFDRGPFTEPHRAQSIGSDRPDDARERRRVVGKCEGAVLVVPETVHASTLANFRATRVGAAGPAAPTRTAQSRPATHSLNARRS